MKDLEHNATPVIFQFVDVSLIDVNADCLVAASSRRASAQVGQAWRQGRWWTAEG
jgi:hypothetical protein